MKTSDQPHSDESASNVPSPAKLFNILFSSEALATQSSILQSAKQAHLSPDARDIHIDAKARPYLEAFRDVLESAIGSLSQQELIPLLDNMLIELHREKQQACSEVEPLPTSDYPKFPDDHVTDPYEWLKENWGHWLKHFSPQLSRDHLFLDQLGELDPALKKALYAKRRSILSKTKCKISEIIPKKSVRLDQQIKESDPEVLRAAVRTYTLPRMRKSKQ